MPSHRRPPRLAGTAVLATGLVAATLTTFTTGLTPASADPAGTDLVISEVYGGGGNSGAPYTNDFIELYNPTDEAIPVDGHVVEYFSGSGNSGGSTQLSGSVPAGGHYLVQQAGGATGEALPTPDAQGTLMMSAGNGSVELRSTQGVLDLVGYGSATRREGTAAPALSNTTSASRNAAGTDTDDNRADFTTGPPAPQNSGSDGGGEPEPDPDPTVATIAEIQGTGAQTPMAGQTVQTEGVVTAAYPEGGFDGFYIQTAGPDTTPGASDGIFVYEPGFADTVEVGDSVTVTGQAKEFNTLTEIDATSVTELAEPLGAVVPNDQIPGTDCQEGACPTAAELTEQYEELEGESFAPTGPITVTDAYDFSATPSTSSNFFGEIGLAVGSDQPLVTPTEVVDAQDTAGIEAKKTYNEAHRVILDDGASETYWNTQNTAGSQDQPVPWLTKDHTVRVGAGVTFEQPVVLDYRYGWKLQPREQVVGVPTGLVTFEQDRPARPEPVAGDLTLATFNVLNYFTTFGADVEGCQPYVDRDEDPVATRTCSGSNGPRGAWEQEDFERQQAKIVASINTMDADIVSLEELENSAVVDGGDRDEAIGHLVEALNAEAGSDRWAYAPSPAAADIPEGEDVIRTGFIYDPTTVELVGDSRILDDPAFVNARDPLAQAFKPADGADEEAFAVVVNHFKSKGCPTSGNAGGDNEKGDQGCYNGDRVRQAQALVTFAEEFSSEAGTDAVFLSGDFNSYTMEDPVQVITEGGYEALESTSDPEEETYSFSGTSGSLDHVFANEAAQEMVGGVDIWETNANESVYYQYARHNYVGTDLYSPGPFAASDHNPEIVGITTSAAEPEPEPVASHTRIRVPRKVTVGKATRAEVRVTAPGDVATSGTVVLKVRYRGAVEQMTKPVREGRARFRIGPWRKPGTVRIVARYSGSEAVAPSRDTAQIRVVRRRR